MEAAPDETEEAVTRALDWLKARQVLDVKGDWAFKRPNLRPGGWAFMYRNPWYVDLDDTAVVVMAMDRSRQLYGTRSYDEAIARAREWVLGMQSANGGWASYEVDNTAYYLNRIPFADHGALLDPPTVDVTARCVAMLGQLGETPQTSVPLRRALDYLLAEQHAEGSWFGRWGINYVYGTWCVLCAFEAIGFDHEHPALRRAVTWLESIQNADGGWGEDDNGYALDYTRYLPSPSVASQTAWALLALMAVGETNGSAVQRGIAYLQAHQGSDGFWPEERYTAVGFPRVFYLRYDGYPKFFPLWALARYRSLRSAGRDPGRLPRDQRVKTVSWTPGRRGDPYAYYAHLRTHSPVIRARIPTRGVGWVVTRYDDVVQVLKDSRFSADPKHSATPPLFGFGGRFAPRLIKLVGDSMICVDDPAHGRLRKLVAKAFTPRSIDDMEPWVSEIVTTMLDDMEARGTVDLMVDFALPLPLKVISEMLGIPEDQRLSFHHQIVRLIEVNDQPIKRAIRWAPAMPRLVRFFEDLIDLKKREPDDRLITRLIAAEEAGDHLSRDELIAMIFLLLFAGHETSVNLIGNGLLALLDHPDQMALLRERPDMMDKAVDELLRLYQPGRIRDDAVRKGARDDRQRDDRAGRDGHGAGGFRQSRRDRISRCRHARHHPEGQPPPRVRSGAALLPRRGARPAGNEDRPRGPSPALSRSPPRRPA